MAILSYLKGLHKVNLQL